MGRTYVAFARTIPLQMVNRLVARTRKGWRPNYEGADRPARKLAKSIELDPEPEDSGEISEERRGILAKIDELMECVDDYASRIVHEVLLFARATNTLNIWIVDSEYRIIYR